MVYVETQMINTNYTITFSDERSHEELEAWLREQYPGLRLIKDYYHDTSRSWNYDIYFDREKDLAWFLLKLKQ